MFWVNKMSEIIHEQLQKYSPSTSEEEANALKEILQEIILCGLSDSGFFEEAVFQGGTSLRIFHGLARFSEDLDFILKKPNPHFKWQPFLKSVENLCRQYGIIPDIIDKSKADNTIKKMFLKDNSIVKLLNLSFHHHAEQKLLIKLEIDTNPPINSISEIKYLDFPLAAAIAVQDLSSNFAGKCHALLCRQYIKGRDWYDFLWYIAKGISPNFGFLSSAMNQQGPWAGQALEITPDWCVTALQEKIVTMDWQKTVNDVYPFLNESDRRTLKLWGVEFFINRLEKLKNTLSIATFGSSHK